LLFAPAALVAIFTNGQPPELLVEDGTYSFGFGDLPPIEEQICWFQ
jgi:hypothetical protein